MGRNRKLKNNIKFNINHLLLNKQYTKTFLIRDYPLYLYPGWIKRIIYPRKKPLPAGVHVNIGLHIQKSNHTLSKHKIDRLQTNVETYENTNKLSEGARDEEKGSLEGMLYFRDKQGELQDMWMTVTVTSKNKKDFKESVKRIKKRLELDSIQLNTLAFEQLQGLEMTWLGGNKDNIKKDYKSRILDMEAMKAFYPFISGNISDESGGYIGHRTEDLRSVYLDFTKDPDNQNMMVVGSSDAGKSTFIKSLIVSLLLEEFKGYVFDVDGEYRSLTKQVGGEYIDYTGDSGKFVDTTIIEPSIMKEINFDSLDEESKEAVLAADKSRFQNAIDSTRAVISMLSEDFNVDKRNAFGYALINMWKKAGIIRQNPETWENTDKSKVSLHKLYQDIVELSEDKESRHQEGAKGLAKDLYSFFDEDGIDSHLFRHPDDGKWIENSQLTVFHVADQVDDNQKEKEQQMGAVKILMITHMMWQQIKRDRIKKQHYSFEVYDELQRLIKNPYAVKSLYRGVTTGRKFNDQVIMGFNDPSILFPNNAGLWNNTKYKVLFSVEEQVIKDLASNAKMPEEVIETWNNLNKYEYILRVRSRRGDLYDTLSVDLPQSEFDRLSKTRGLN